MSRGINIIYEDNHLLVVEKPVNIPVQADASGDRDLLSLLKEYIKEKYQKPGEVYLGLVHRLDRPVGGVMVFARTSKAAARLSEQFGGRGAKKRYAAVICGASPREGYLRDYIVRDEKTGDSRIAKKDEQNAKSASLSLSPVASLGGHTLLDIELHSGRHHQIRVQLASRGAPIYGDARYNANAVPGQQIALWAYSLTFEHPTKHERMTFTSMPRGGAWADFEAQLAALVKGVRLAYVDENVFVVNKKRGVGVSAEDCGDNESLETLLCDAFGAAYPVHRLDVPTSGLVMLARNEKSKAELDAAIRDRKIRKLYRCIVLGVPSRESGAYESYITKDADASRVRVTDAPRDGAKEAITKYRVIKRMEIGGEVCSLVEAELVTGRTHQIRAQFSHEGHPLLGDDKYGDREWNRFAPEQMLCLCAVSIKAELDKSSFLNYLNGVSISVTEPF